MKVIFKLTDGDGYPVDREWNYFPVDVDVDGLAKALNVSRHGDLLRVCRGEWAQKVKLDIPDPYDGFDAAPPGIAALLMTCILGRPIAPSADVRATASARQARGGAAFTEDGAFLFYTGRLGTSIGVMPGDTVHLSLGAKFNALEKAEDAGPKVMYLWHDSGFRFYSLLMRHLRDEGPL